MAYREEVIGPHRLILGDCLEVMQGLQYDGILADVPYGIGYKRGAGGKGLRVKSDKHTPKHDGKAIIGDERPFDPAPFLHCPCILWGANHYAQRLPHGRWLAWNKLGQSEPWDDFSDVEFAWQNKRAADRIFSHLWKGAFKASPEIDGKRVHPTQKPVALMEWCLGFLTGAQMILDPFAGSGTVAVACERTGRKSISIELDPGYFDIACRRVEAAMRQPRLDLEPPPKAEQIGMDL